LLYSRERVVEGKRRVGERLPGGLLVEEFELSHAMQSRFRHEALPFVNTLEIPRESQGTAENVEKLKAGRRSNAGIDISAPFGLYGLLKQDYDCYYNFCREVHYRFTLFLSL
jgi:hypothetical protein